MKKIFVLTGEPSGDKLASEVISQMKTKKTDLEFLIRDALSKYFPKLEIINLNLEGKPDSNLISFTMNFRIMDTQVEDEITINFEQ